MKTKLTMCILMVLVFSSFLKNQLPKYPYQNSKLSDEERIKDLLSRMTLEEKIAQLDMFRGREVSNIEGRYGATAYKEDSLIKYVGKNGGGSIHDLYPVSADIINEIQKYAVEKTRLGIPFLFIEEGLHGYEGPGGTSFPIPLAMSAMWDTTLVRKIGHVIATESRAHGVNMILGPVLCLPRDPRWGRVEETFGEDTYLDAVNGVAMVKGLQGKNLKSADAVIAEPKHYAVHGIPEAGSNTSPINMGEREARSSFLYVFEKAVREGGALGMMAAYSELDGVPCVVNKWLLTDVLRKEWGFQGFVLSDLGAIRMSQENHHTSKDIQDVLAQTFKAGMNMQFYDYNHREFMTAMKEIVNKKMLSTDDLNKTVHDVLKVKFLLGLFDNPYIEPSLKEKVFHSKEHIALSLQAAQQSICLLKNDNHMLPLNSNIKSIAVVGELATSTYLGGYANLGDKAMSILDGLKQRDGGFKINYAQGYNMESPKPELIQQAVDFAKNAEVVVAVIGENIKQVGEGKDRAHLELDKDQMDLLKALKETGKPIVAVLLNGRPLCINWVAENVPSILESWFLGENLGLAVADALLGKINPSGKLPMTFPRSVGQIPFYYNHKPTSMHKYVDELSGPLFAFGHGLSYTTFEYSDLKIMPQQISSGGSATVSTVIKNTGTKEGAEVAQLYIKDMVSSVTTPVMSLRGFQRIILKPGKSGVIQFKIDADALSLWNREMKRVVESGEFKIMVGSSSQDIRKEGKLIVL